MYGGRWKTLSLSCNKNGKSREEEGGYLFVGSRHRAMVPDPMNCLTIWRLQPGRSPRIGWHLADRSLQVSLVAMAHPIEWSSLDEMNATLETVDCSLEERYARRSPLGDESLTCSILWSYGVYTCVLAMKMHRFRSRKRRGRGFIYLICVRILTEMIETLAVVEED